MMSYKEIRKDRKMELSLWAVVAGYAIVGLVTYVSVLLAVATVRWKEARKKRMFAEMIMNNLGERFAMDMTFQDIVKNFQIKDDEEDGGKK
jgi:hypothetical protein